MIKKYFLIGLMFNWFGIGFSQSTLTNAQAINIAGRERMLAQRLAKDKVYESMDALPLEVSKEINSSIIIFEENLKLITEYATTNELKSKTDAISLIWIGYKENILSKSNESVKNVFKFNNIMFTACDDLLKELILMSNADIYDSSNPYIQLSNTAKLKYLSQRFALYYATYYYKVETQDNEEFNAVVKDFDTTITNLIVAKLKTQQTNEAINEIIKSWKELKDPIIKEKTATGFDFTKPDLPNPEKVFTNCNSILNQVDKLTGMYLAMIKI